MQVGQWVQVLTKDGDEHEGSVCSHDPAVGVLVLAVPLGTAGCFNFVLVPLAAVARHGAAEGGAKGPGPAAGLQIHPDAAAARARRNVQARQQQLQAVPPAGTAPEAVALFGALGKT